MSPHMPLCPRHQRPSRRPVFLFGAPYYPEHWTDADRLHDPQRMEQAGFNVVRMAEFAWDRMEPCQGQFDFTLFDQTITQLPSSKDLITREPVTGSLTLAPFGAAVIEST